MFYMSQMNPNDFAYNTQLWRQHLFHVIDSLEILGSTEGIMPYENKTDLGWLLWRIRLNVESCSHQTPEYANSNHENPPNTILNRFFEFTFVEN